mgnify:CR=1 FL=1
MKSQKQKIVKCPVCGTPCIIKGVGDFNDKDKANTFHYQSLWQETNRELQEAKARIKKLENIIKARLNYCQQQNGLPYCKNCGLDEDDLK